MQGRVGGSLATTQIGSLATIGSLGPIRITWHHGHRITWPHQDHRLLACTHAGPFWWVGVGRWGWGWGGWDDNVSWLAHRHAETWSGLPALGLHTCWPILVGGGGVGGMITYLGLHTDTPKGGLVYSSTTPVPLFTTKYNSSITITLYCSSTTPHQTLCSGYLPKFQPMLRLPTKVTLQHHQIMRLPQEVTLQHDQILRLPRKVTL